MVVGNLPCMDSVGCYRLALFRGVCVAYFIQEVMKRIYIGSAVLVVGAAIIIMMLLLMAKRFDAAYEAQIKYSNSKHK
jgi:hypothetical protein